MSILVVNQSVIDIFGSLFSLITSTVKTGVTGLNRDSVYDQFLCRFWLTKIPFWAMVVTSTYGILLTTLSRYFAVIYPIKYKYVRNIYFLKKDKCTPVHDRNMIVEAILDRSL